MTGRCKPLHLRQHRMGYHCASCHERHLECVVAHLLHIQNCNCSSHSKSRAHNPPGKAARCIFEAPSVGGTQHLHLAGSQWCASSPAFHHHSFWSTHQGPSPTPCSP